MNLSSDLIALSNSLMLGKYGVIANKRLVKTTREVLSILDTPSYKNASIAEIGPGPVLVLLKNKIPELLCTSFQSPHEKTWITRLAPYSISIREWDLNQPLTKGVEEKYDVILLLEVLEHLNRWPEFVLRDIYYLLKPGGHLILTTPNLHRISNRSRMVMGLEPADPFKYTPTGEHHVREFSFDEITVLLSNANFEDVDVRYWAARNGILGKFQQTLTNLMPGLFADLIFAVARR